MSLINITNLTFAYEGSYDNIFENINFQIDTDWKLGFTGRNGRGKTTLLNLLMGKYAYEGSILASVSFEYFPYAVKDPEADTLEVVNSILADYEQWRLHKEMNLLDVPADVLFRPFSTLSNGEQTKVLLAVLFLKGNSFLLIDEPTNHLDMEARRIVGDYLNAKKGFILVSHDREFLDRCVDHIFSINKTNIEVKKGNFSSWWHNKKLQDGFEMAENERLKKDIRRLEEAAKQTSRWSDQMEKTKKGTKISGLRPDRGHLGHKAAKMMQRSKSMEGRLQAAMDQKSNLLKNIEVGETLKIHPLAYHADTLFRLEDVSVFYGGRTVCWNVSFVIQAGDRIALCGENGTGKTSLLKLICGEEIPFKGALKKGSGLKISYVPQDTSYLMGNLTDFAREGNIDESLFKTILRKFDFPRVQFEKDMRDFSAGQKKKALVARSLCEQAHLYVWDEPLNYVDVISRMQIEELLKEFAPTVLFVEHDSAFSSHIATKTVELQLAD